MENWTLIFIWINLSLAWRLNTKLVNLLVLTQLISCDYFSTKPDISGHFDVLSFIYFKCNLFCTIASYVWCFSADSLGQMSATQLEVCWTAGLFLKPRLMFIASHPTDLILAEFASVDHFLLIWTSWRAKNCTLPKLSPSGSRPLSSWPQSCSVPSKIYPSSVL